MQEKAWAGIRKDGLNGVTKVSVVAARFTTKIHLHASPSKHQQHSRDPGKEKYSMLSNCAPDPKPFDRLLRNYLQIIYLRRQEPNFLPVLNVPQRDLIAYRPRCCQRRRVCFRSSSVQQKPTTGHSEEIAVQKFD